MVFLKVNASFLHFFLHFRDFYETKISTKCQETVNIYFQTECLNQAVYGWACTDITYCLLQ